MTRGLMYETVSRSASTHSPRSQRIKRAIGTTAMGCSLCMGVAFTPVAPASASLAPSTIQALVDNGTLRHADPDDCSVQPAPATLHCPDWISSHDPGTPHNTVVVATPGTDDGTLYPRLKGMRAGRETLIVNYPESLGPIVSGRSHALLPFFAPTYDQSKNVAIANNLRVMSAFADLPNAPRVVYTGYSQGSDALGDAAERAVADGTIDIANSHIILVSDPRSPWGLKAWAADSLPVSALFTLLGAQSNGARNPGATGEQLPVTSVVVVGDPAANFQWLWYRPFSSLLVDAAGFLTIHAGAGADNYGNLIDYSLEPTVLKSVDGNTTYLIYRPSHHPLTMLAMLIYDELGIRYTAADLKRWDKANDTFYPLQSPGVDNAAVPVTATDHPETDDPDTADPSTPSAPSVTSTAKAHTLISRATTTTQEPSEHPNPTNIGDPNGTGYPNSTGDPNGTARRPHQTGAGHTPCARNSCTPDSCAPDPCDGTCWRWCACHHPRRDT